LKEQLEHILDAVPDGVVVIGRDRYIAFANIAAEKIFGFKRDYIIGRTYDDPAWKATALDGKPIPHEKHPFTEVMQTGEPVHDFEHIHERPDKTRVIVSANAIPLYDKAGAVAGVVISLKDITERKRAAEEVKESRKQILDILESIADSFFALDELWRFTYINCKAEQLIGKRREEVLYKNFLEVFPKEFGSKLNDEFKKAAEGQAPVIFDIFYPRASKWFEVHAYPYKNGLSVYLSDITERKQAEEELSLKSLLLDSATDSIFVHDFDGKMLYVNEAAYNARGYTKEELLAIPLRELDVPEQAKLIGPRIKQILKRGGLVFESAHFKKDGTVLPIEVHSRIIEHGGRKLVVSVARDITKRKKIEKRLRLFMEAVEEAPDGVQITDLDGYVIYSNKAIERMYGFSPEELKGKHVNEMNADPELASKVILPSILKTGGWAGEVMVKAKDGRVFPVWLTTSLVKDAKGNPIALVGIARDISTQKRAKELSDALNNINAAISSTLDLDEIMRRVVVVATQAIGVETAAIALLEDRHWVARYIYGFPEEKIGTHFTNEEVPHAVLAARTKKPVVINDAYSDERVNREVMEALNIRSVLVVPLILKGDVVGVLYFNYHSKAVSFDEAQVDFANKLATSISLALENSRLYTAERNIADTLQESLLIIPERIEGVIYGRLYHSATEAAKVGGDFYDIFEIEHGKVGIIVGDVSGKGIEAAALTSIVKNTIKAHAYEDGTPALIMAKANDLLLKTSPASIFVTVFFGVLDTETGKLAYCSAGHPPAIIKRETGSVVLLAKHSPVVGAFSRMNYRSGKETLRKGDVLIVYTDGIIEARRDRDFFKEERLVGLIENLEPMPVEDIPHTVFNYVMDFSQGKLLDDVALLAVSLEGD